MSGRRASPIAQLACFNRQSPAPSHANRADWGNAIALEIFHYWNGWRMRGADYAASQWFQEGFTEYAANLAMVSSGVIDERLFREQLARHITNYARLATTLEAPGSRKGPPLYSGGRFLMGRHDPQRHRRKA